MPLPAVLFALLTAGFWIPCLVDVARTPRHEFQRLTKGTWLLLVAAFWVFGAVAWMLIRRPAWRWREPSMRRDAARPAGPGPQEALRRHPAGRAMEPGYDGNAADGAGQQAPGRPTRTAGPDDDPEFLLELSRRIREAREDH
jgi:Phospholipase_D-nuclease N-terminal